ncbi:hypothetical protein MASR1M32_03520 [Rhodobacter sp.]
METPVRKHLIVDALQHSKPSRARFLEWQVGGVGCVHVTLNIWESARDTLRNIAVWNRLYEDNADLIELATSAEDIERISASGRTAIIYGFQNTAGFEDDLDLVEIFHQLGVRIAQLTYNTSNSVAVGCWEEEGGLKPYFGRNVIREMNRVGMLVDLSHCNDQSTYDAMEFSARPVAVTHANPSAFVGTDIELQKRNKSDDIIKKLAE